MSHLEVVLHSVLAPKSEGISRKKLKVTLFKKEKKKTCLRGSFPALTFIILHLFKHICFLITEVEMKRLGRRQEASASPRRTLQHTLERLLI